jgi:hypothetical protein
MNSSSFCSSMVGVAAMRASYRSLTGGTLPRRRQGAVNRASTGFDRAITP